MAEKFSLTAQLHLQAPKNVKQVFNQVQSQLKGATVDVDVKGGAKAIKDLNSIASATKKVQKESKSAQTAANRMGKAFGSALKNVLRYDLARRVFTAFTNTIEQGVSDAIKFEREMIKIAQVSGQTMKQLKGLERTITQLSTSLGVSSASLAKVGLILKQTGLSVRDTQIAMSALAKTELAPTFDNIADTAETAVAAMRQFGIESSKLETLLSRINTVAANFAVEASDIGVAIKRAGGAFKAAGGEVEELIALFTSVRATTRETAETIATGFRTIFTRLQRPTTIKFLREFGIELTDLQGKFVGPMEAVKRLSTALQNLSPQDLRFSTIVEQLGGFRQVSKVIPLIQQFGTAQEALNAQMKGSDSLTRDAATAQQSLAVQMQKVTENVKELFRNIVASDAFQTMAKGAVALANALTKIANAMAPLIPIMTAFAAARAAAWVGGKLFSGGLGGLNKALGTASGDASDVFRGNRGGRVRRFSRGGWVPGTGNGDTVPAMLEPGEFVLRKSAAQAFGPQLEGINKYNKGGGVNAGDFSQIGLQKRVIRARKVGGLYKAAQTAMDKDVQFNENDNFRLSGFERVPLAVTKEPGKKKGDPSIYRITGRKALRGRSRAAAKSYLASKTGANWEKLLETTNYMSTKGGKFGGISPFDGMDDGVYVEARSRQAKTSEKTVVEKGVQQAIQGEMPVSQLTAKRNKMQLPFAAKLIEDVGKQQFASGGMVPSLLTPGEFVVNKKSAQSFGYGKLRNMNKYAGGGTVSRFNTGGGVMGGGGAMGGMMNLAFMKSFQESAVGATKSLYGAAEGAFFAYSKFQVMGAAANALGTSVGLGGKTLDAFTGILGESLGVLSAFNTALKSEAVLRSFDFLGGKIKGLGSLVGRVSGKAGGSIGKIGQNVGSGSFGLFATKQRVNTRAADVFGRRSASLRQGAVGTAKEMRERAGRIRALRAEQKSLLGPKGGQPRGVGAAAKKARLKEIKGSMSALKGHQTRAKATIDAAKKSAKGMSNAAKASAKTAKMFKALNVAGFVATYAVGKLGDSIQKGALETIRKGEAGDYSGMFGTGEAGIRKKAGVGGGIKGAATGAAIGMIFGPLGAAVGLATGALYGYITATKEAEEEIKKAKFRKALEGIAETMQDFADGNITQGNALQQLDTQARTLSQNQAAVSFQEGNEGEQQVRDASLKLAKSLAASSTSVAEFDVQIQQNARNLISQGFLYKSNINLLREEIKKREQVQAKLDLHAQAIEESRKQIERLRGLSGALQETENRMKSFGNIISAIADPLTNVGVGQGTANLVRGSDRNDTASIKRFNSAIMGFSNIVGEMNVTERGTIVGLGGQGKAARDFGFLERNVEGIVSRASRTGTLEGRAEEEIRRQIQLAWERESGGQLNRENIMRGPESGGVRLIQSNPEAVLGKLFNQHIDKVLSAGDIDLATPEGRKKITDALESGAERFREVFEEAGKLLDGHLIRLSSAYEKQTKLQLDYIKQQKDLLKQRQEVEQQYLDNISTDNFGGISNEKVQSQFNARQRLALSGAGRVGDLGPLKDLPLSVSAIKKEFLETGAALDKSNEAISRIGSDTDILGDGQSNLLDSTSGLIKENDKLKKRYSILQGVLQDYTNSQQRLVALNRELQQAQQKQKTLRQLAEQARFGTAEEKAAAKNIINAVTLAIKAGSIDAVRPELQRQVLSLLPQVAGKEGQAIIDKDLNASFAQFGGGAGITSASAEQRRIAGEIKAIQDIGIEAGKALAAETSRKIDSMEDAIKRQNEKFIADLTHLFTEEAKRQELSDDLEALATLEGLEKQQDVLFRLSKKIGSSSEGDLIRARQFIVGRSEQELENRKMVEKSTKSVGNLKNTFKWLGGASEIVDSLENITQGKAQEEIQNDSWWTWARKGLVGAAEGLAGEGGIAPGTIQMAEARIRAYDKRGTGKLTPLEEKAEKELDLGNSRKVVALAKMMEMLTGGTSPRHWQTIETALDEGIDPFRWNENMEDLGVEARAAVQDIKRSMKQNALEAGLFQTKGDKTGEQQFDEMWNTIAKDAGKIDFGSFIGQVLTKLEEKQTQAIESITKNERARRDLNLPENWATMFDEDDMAVLREIKGGFRETNNQIDRNLKFLADSENLLSDDKKLIEKIKNKRKETLDLLKKGSIRQQEEKKRAEQPPAAPPKSLEQQHHDAKEFSDFLKRGARPLTPREQQQKDAEDFFNPNSPNFFKPTQPPLRPGHIDPTKPGGGLPQNNKLTLPPQIRGASPEVIELYRKHMEDVGKHPGGIKLEGGIKNFGTEQSLKQNKPPALLQRPFSPYDHLPSIMKNKKQKVETELKNHESPNSIATYDQTTEALLQKMLTALNGGGSVNSTSVAIDTRALDDSVQKFSQSVTQLSTLMGNPLGITVGGTITMDVKLNGAEWFRDAENSLMQLAASQITRGINNFIRNGLKDSRVLTNPDWVNDTSEAGVPVGRNPHSGTV